jgi:FkbM family methyltransferase
MVGNMTFATRITARSTSALLRLIRRRIAGSVVQDADLGLERIGTDYGGWIVPTHLIKVGWLCYCGGVGEDISFDLDLIRRFGVTVYAFDPTPRAIRYAEAEAKDEARLHFLPVGLWSEDATLRFFAPQDPSHVSHSVVNLQKTTTFFEARCRSVASLKADLGHEHIDLVKLDIEGAEHRVIESMLSAGIRPTVLCTEIDQPVGPLRFWLTIRRVRSAGYALVAMSGWNFTFVRKEALAGDSGDR